MKKFIYAMLILFASCINVADPGGGAQAYDVPLGKTICSLFVNSTYLTRDSCFVFRGPDLCIELPYLSAYLPFSGQLTIRVGPSDWSWEGAESGSSNPWFSVWCKDAGDVALQLYILYPMVESRTFYLWKKEGDDPSPGTFQMNAVQACWKDR